MGKWFDRIDKALALVFLLLYAAAKVHFFTRYASVGIGAYVEEHLWFWAAMAVVALAAMVLTWLRKRVQQPPSNHGNIS